MDIKDRIYSIINFKSLSVREFERLCGWSNGYASKVTDGLSNKKIESILHAFPDISRVWLQSGVGDMVNKNTSTAKSLGGVYMVTSRDEEVHEVDFVPASAHATFAKELLQDSTELEKVPVLLTRKEKEEIENLKIFEVEGDSMFPTICDGAQILTCQIPEYRWHNISGVVVVVYNNYVVVKRVKNNRLDEGYIVLSSDNVEYGERTIQRSEIRAIFKATRIISSDLH